MKELKIKDADGTTLLLLKIDVKGESYIRKFSHGCGIKAIIGEVSLLDENEELISNSIGSTDQR